MCKIITDANKYKYLLLLTGLKDSTSQLPSADAICFDFYQYVARKKMMMFYACS